MRRDAPAPARCWQGVAARAGGTGRPPVAGGQGMGPSPGAGAASGMPELMVVPTASAARPGWSSCAGTHTCTHMCTHMNMHMRVHTLGPERLGQAMEKRSWQADLSPHVGPGAVCVHRWCRVPAETRPLITGMAELARGGLEPLTPHSGWGLPKGRMKHRLLLTQSIPRATLAGTGLGRAKGWGDGALPGPAEGHTESLFRGHAWVVGSHLSHPQNGSKAAPVLPALPIRCPSAPVQRPQSTGPPWGRPQDPDPAPCSLRSPKLGNT